MQKWNINIIVLVLERPFNVKVYGQASIAFTFTKFYFFFSVFFYYFKMRLLAVSRSTLGQRVRPDLRGSKRTFAFF